MEELLKALTRAANAVAVYYEKQAHPLLPLVDAPAPTPAAEPQPEKVRKPRKAAEPAPAPAPAAAAAPAPAPAPAAPVAAGDMTEEQSLKEVRAIAKTFVQRFANQVDGITAFRKLMADTCKVGKIDDLVHAQRLQVITAAKAEIAKGATPAPVAAGVEV